MSDCPGCQSPLMFPSCWRCGWGKDPVCSTCNDTHRMELREQIVPCTRCPLPCRSCATSGGRGAYCEATPCRCACHVTTRRHPHVSQLPPTEDWSPYP